MNDGRGEPKHTSSALDNLMNKEKSMDWTRDEPDHEFYLARAIISLVLGDAKTAVSDCSKVIQDNNDSYSGAPTTYNERFHCIRGIGYCELGEQDKAEADFTEIIQSIGKYMALPPPVYAVFNRGVARVEQGKFALAKNDFLNVCADHAHVGTDGEIEQSAFDIGDIWGAEGLDSDCLVYLGQCYAKTNNTEEAIRCYSRAIEILTPNTDNERAYDQIGHFQRLPGSHPYSQHRYRIPLGYYDRLLGYAIEAEDPNDISSDSDIHFAESPPYFYPDYIRYLRGECQYRLEKYSEAIEDISPYMDTLPENQSKGAYYFIRSKAYRTIGMLEECMTDSERMMDVDPDNKWSYYNLARGHRALLEYEKAVSAFTKALDIDPGNDYFRYLRGECRYHLEEYNEAIEEMSPYMETLPENQSKGMCYFVRSRAYRKIGMLQECMTDSERMIDVDPDNKWSYYNLAQALSTRTLAKYEKAKLVCTKALDIDPRDDYFLYLRGYCLIQIGDKTKGLEDLSAAIEINPKNANAKRLLKGHVD